MRLSDEAGAEASGRVSSGCQVVGATAHDGGQTRARHVGDLAHATDDSGVSSPGLGVVDGGEARCHTRLTCGDGDVPGFESGHGTRCLLDFFGSAPGCQRRDREDAPIGRHGLSPADVLRDSAAADGRGDRI